MRQRSLSNAANLSSYPVFSRLQEAVHLLRCSGFYIPIFRGKWTFTLTTLQFPSVLWGYCQTTATMSQAPSAPRSSPGPNRPSTFSLCHLCPSNFLPHSSVYPHLLCCSAHLCEGHSSCPASSSTLSCFTQTQFCSFLEWTTYSSRQSLRSAQIS